MSRVASTMARRARLTASGRGRRPYLRLRRPEPADHRCGHWWRFRWHSGCDWRTRVQSTYWRRNRPWGSATVKSGHRNERCTYRHVAICDGPDPGGFPASYLGDSRWLSRLGSCEVLTVGTDGRACVSSRQARGWQYVRYVAVGPAGRSDIDSTVITPWAVDDERHRRTLYVGSRDRDDPQQLPPDWR